MLESSDEREHVRPTKVARYARFILPHSRETDQHPRTAPPNKPSGTGEVAANKPRGLADVRHRSPMVNTVIEDFDYRKVESETETEDEDIGDDLEYPGNLPVSLVRPFSYLLNRC